MKINHHTFLLIIIPFFLVFFSCVSKTCEARRVRVEITNGLGENTNLTLHCKSRDNDLGVQFLRYEDTWGFSFHPNIFGTTQFYCSFQWSGSSDIHRFDIYGPKQKSCRYCQWRVYTDGICRFDPVTHIYDLCSDYND